MVATARPDIRPARRTDTRAPRIIEGVLVALLTILLLLQLFSYPATDDPDPDGYVSYAQHLLATGKLMPESRRLPGYPAFLALADKVSGRPLARDVYWVQLTLTVIFVLVAWSIVRRHVGPLTALIFLGILAAPSYFTRMSVVMLPDVPYTLLWLPVFLTMAWWVAEPELPGGWLWIIPFGLGLFVLQAIRPTTLPLAILLAVGLAVAVAFVFWRSERPYGVRVRWRLSHSLTRVAGIIAVALFMSFLTDRLLDTGAREYGADHVPYRVVIFLPPAADTPADQRIEAAKQRFQEVEGEPIERARFLTYRSFAFYDEMKREDVLAVWQGRLLANPGRYLTTVFDDLRHGHYLLARYIVPFFFDVDRAPLFRVYYPRDDGSPASNLFRQTGLIVLEREPFPSNFPLEIETVQAILRLVVVWGLLGLGSWQLGRRWPEVTAGFALACVLFVVMIAATNTVDGRYLLPFAPLAYLAQAAGLSWMLVRLVRQEAE